MLGLIIAMRPMKHSRLVNVVVPEKLPMESVQMRYIVVLKISVLADFATFQDFVGLINAAKPNEWQNSTRRKVTSLVCIIWGSLWKY